MYTPATPGPTPTAPAPSPPPPPEESEGVPAAPRYAYLVSRLRNRQITMEEATELFAIQREQVRTLLTRTNALVAAAAAPALARPARPAPPPPPPGVPAVLGELDPWAEGLLFLTVGAGVLAALIKRSQGNPPAPAEKSGKTSTPVSSSRRS